ncbi:MAG: hypothetical protein AAB896_00210, partial [Patescibacteria group bacterium]
RKLGGLDFNEVYERCGIPKKYRSLRYFNPIVGPDGLTYVIPKEIDIHGELYDMTVDGVTVHKTAHWDRETFFGEGAMLGPGVQLLGENAIGVRTEIGPDVTIKNSYIGHYAIVGSGAEITDSAVHSSGEPKTFRGIQVGGTLIDSGVEIANSEIYPNVCIGSESKITESTIGSNVHLGPEVTVDFSAIGEWSLVMPEVSIGPDEKIKPNTLVYKRKAFKRARKV